MDFIEILLSKHKGVALIKGSCVPAKNAFESEAGQAYVLKKKPVHINRLLHFHYFVNFVYKNRSKVGNYCDFWIHSINDDILYN